MTTSKSSKASSRPRAADPVVVRGSTVVRRSDGSFKLALKISDPDARKDVKALQDRLIRSPKQAEALLRETGLHTATGRLTKRFGG